MLRAFASGSVFGASYGTGSARVLALHGWARDHHDFDAVGAIDLGSALVAIDLPGFGATPPPTVAMGSGGYATAIAPMLDEIDEPVVLVGHSFGGRVALHLAMAFPDRIGALVLTGVPLVRAAPAPAPFAYRMVRRLRAVGLVSNARLEAARRRYGSADYRAVDGIMRDVLVRTVNEDYESLIPYIAQPVVMVWGANDTTTPPEIARAVMPTFRNARVELVAGVGHLLPLEAPEALGSVIARMIG